MKVSVFTPTHDVTWLFDCYKSLLAQSIKDWEWVIIPNNKAVVPAQIASDSRVKVIPSRSQGIGALKHFACSHCSGDLLVELDHDDLLTSDALEVLIQTAEANPPGFYYSDFVNFMPNGNSATYPKEEGWENYGFSYEGNTYDANRAFPPSPSIFSNITWAPNHIRAWHRSVYYLAGGHDIGMVLGDDHDLLCRTYLSGVPFIHIPKVLYLYRLRKGSKGNTHNQPEPNAQIQVASRDTCHKYLHRISLEWARRNNLLTLDLVHSEKDKDSSYTSAVTLAECEVTGLLQLTEKNALGVFRAYDVLHNLDNRQVIALMNQIHASMAPGGILLLAVPSTDGRGAFSSLDARSYWNENTIWGFTHSKFRPEFFEGRFQALRLWTECPSSWHLANKIPYVYAELCALKGQRQPGQTFI